MGWILGCWRARQGSVWNKPFLFLLVFLTTTLSPPQKPSISSWKRTHLWWWRHTKWTVQNWWKNLSIPSVISSKQTSLIQWKILKRATLKTCTNVGLTMWRTTWKRKSRGRSKWRGKTHHQPKSWNPKTETFVNQRRISSNFTFFQNWQDDPSCSLWSAGEEDWFGHCQKMHGKVSPLLFCTLTSRFQWCDFSWCTRALYQQTSHNTGVFLLPWSMCNGQLFSYMIEFASAAFSSYLL